MLSTLDLLYICLSISVLVFAGFFAYAAIQIGLTVKAIRKTIDNVEITTSKVKSDLSDLTEGLKFGILGLIAKYLKKGGEKIYG